MSELSCHDERFWAYLIHLGTNCHLQWGPAEVREEKSRYAPRDFLLCETEVWNTVTEKMAGAGVNMLVIDLAEGVKYESRPELAVRNSWTPKRLRGELDRLRKMGIEPVPKLNFSACHDDWLGEYSRMVSTDIYYRVCGDLISEVSDIFDSPRFFHIGMDEETAVDQKNLDHVVIRQHDLWWEDLYFLAGEVEKAGSRAWVWSDAFWNNQEVFAEKMPRKILQSNWYYGKGFSGEEVVVESAFSVRAQDQIDTYIKLDKLGFDQVPAGSNHRYPGNFIKTVKFCVENLSPEKLAGFFQTPWRPATRAFYEHHMEAIEGVRSSLEWYNSRRERSGD